jgi:hypothetical protein
MVNRLCSGWRSPLMLIAAALVCGPPVASAATLSVETMLADFHFDGVQVDYNPDLRDLVVRFDSPQVTFSATDGSTPPESYDTRNNLQAALFLDDKDYGDVLRVAFNTFGSLPAVLEASESQLLKDSALAVGGGTLQFIVDTNTVAGPLASRYRDAAIYMTVAGLNVEDWLNGYGAPGSPATYSFINAAEDVAGNGLTPAVPVPPTLFLFLAAGIPLMLTRRRG